jgi:hypothetical protein
MSRRVHRVGTGLVWRALQQRLHEYGQDSLLSFLDGKPLPIGGASTDAEAGYGRAARSKAKGYKLHCTTWRGRRAINCWRRSAREPSRAAAGTTRARTVCGVLR